MPNFNTKDIAFAAIFTSLVASCTMVFSVFVPATRGFFNIGEVMIYTAALVMGPWVGAFAGGVGSSLADVILGYGHYAPGTLVIKGIEGFIVGYLGRLGLSKLGIKSWRLVTIVVGVISGSLVWMIGTEYVSGNLEFTMGIPEGLVSTPTFTTMFNVPQIFWMGIAALIFLSIIVMGFSITPKIGWVVIAVLAGGVEMIIGYFLYQTYILQIGFVTAMTEIPFNFGQMIIGLLVAIPLSRSVLKILPKLQQVNTKS